VCGCVGVCVCVCVNVSVFVCVCVCVCQNALNFRPYDKHTSLLWYIIGYGCKNGVVAAGQHFEDLRRTIFQIPYSKTTPRFHPLAEG
jgi:hypothetical protein